MTKMITVLGAGSVGVGTAIHLQQRGWKVTLIDRKSPGQETSYGNAGVINTSSFVPMNNPALHSSLWSLLLNNTSKLRYNPMHVIRTLPWSLRFLGNSKSTTAALTASALQQLIEPALDEHKALMQRSGNMHRLTELGWLKLFRSRSVYDEQSFEAQTFRQYNVKIEHLGADDIKEMEPALKPIYKSGFLLAGSGHVNNPGALISEYADQFVADGGTLRHHDIQQISQSGDGFRLHSAAESIDCDSLVITAGPWSADLLQHLGYSVMLGFERGYHQHFRLANGATLNRSMHDVEAGYVLGPMEQGVRLTTGVELNHRDAPSSLSQLNKVLPKLHEAVDIESETEHPIWRGSRPTFPDSRPVIGRAPGQPNLWMAFGHQHIGLMSGPVTGKLLSQLISGEKTDIGLQPFAPDRYVRQ